ncbi:hypothetical protein ACTG15_06555 [Aeromonas sp. 164P]
MFEIVVAVNNRHGSGVAVLSGDETRPQMKLFSGLFQLVVVKDPVHDGSSTGRHCPCTAEISSRARLGPMLGSSSELTLADKPV